MLDKVCFCRFTEDSLLGPVPSRIPKLHQLYQHSDRRLTSQRDRDSFEMSVTSSDYDRDFTASNDSGIEIRDMKTCCIRRPQNSPGTYIYIHLHVSQIRLIVCSVYCDLYD